MEDFRVAKSTDFIAAVLAWSHGSELPVSQIVTLIVLA